MNLKDLLHITEPKDHPWGVPVELPKHAAILTEIQRTQAEIWNFFANVFGIERSDATQKALDYAQRKLANETAKTGRFEQPYPPVRLDEVMPFDYADKVVQLLVRAYAVADRSHDLQSLIKARDMIAFAFTEWENQQSEKERNRRFGNIRGEAKKAEAAKNHAKIRAAAIKLLNAGKDPRNIASILEARGYGSKGNIRVIIKDLKKRI